ncbi:MAG: hypothetical protein KDK70_20420, partial [Myxococcales bacterium]|nr:hypothetical protein [Myxococcales bacterium]
LKVACAAMLVLLVPVLGWYGGPERALRREAKARGMTSGTIARVFAIAGHGSLAGLRESVVTRVMWRTWCSGQPTDMVHCLELAERLRGQGRLDSLQRWFVEQLEPMRAQSHHSESSRRRTP